MNDDSWKARCIMIIESFQEKNFILLDSQSCLFSNILLLEQIQ